MALPKGEKAWKALKKQYKALEVEQKPDFLCKYLKTVDDVQTLFNELADSDAERHNLFLAVVDKLYSLIHSVEDFASILKCFVDSDRDTLYFDEKISQKFASWTSSANDLGLFLEGLSENTFNDYCETNEVILRARIKSLDDLLTVFNGNTRERCQAIYDRIQHEPVALTTSITGLIDALRQHSPEHIELLCQVMYNELPQLINSNNILISLLNNLNPQQAKIACKAVHSFCPGPIAEILREIHDVKIREAVCEAIAGCPIAKIDVDRLRALSLDNARLDSVIDPANVDKVVVLREPLRKFELLFAADKIKARQLKTAFDDLIRCPVFRGGNSKAYEQYIELLSDMDTVEVGRLGKALGIKGALKKYKPHEL